MQAGRFRRDLYYRLASWTVELPPLSERIPDIIPLAEHFLGDGEATSAPFITPAVRDYLLRRSYPGNIRDLRQLCLRMRGRHVGAGGYTVGDIPPDERKPPAAVNGDWRRGGFEAGIRRAIELGSGLKEISTAASDVAIDIATQGGSVALAKAAQQLKITPRALQLRRQKRSA